IVAGERRYRALVELGRDSAPVVVRELTDRQMLVLALVENLQRENLSPLEEARGYRQLMRDFDLTQAQVAERVGRDR
ncbi:MAG: ParB/RepB/Spo0J family partition protein, partial [Gemmatimonadota bacterium]